jgi:hypothetical protein
MRTLLVEPFLACSTSGLQGLPTNHLKNLFFNQWKSLSTLQTRIKAWIMDMEFINLMIQASGIDLTPKNAEKVIISALRKKKGLESSSWKTCQENRLSSSRTLHRST